MTSLRTLANEALADWQAIRTNRQLAECITGASYGIAASFCLIATVAISLITL